MLWINGDTDHSLADGHAFYHAHPFNVGQHVAHNAMLDECMSRGVDWHIRMDDDCWMTTKNWLNRLLAVQEKVKAITGKYCVLSPNVEGLDNPPPAIRGYEMGREIIESVEMLGGIFRMSPMSMMRYFRWDERQAMGFGDATQFRSFCESVAADRYRVRTIRCTHGESTQKQSQDADWSHEHDMLQYIPLGL